MHDVSDIRLEASKYLGWNIGGTRSSAIVGTAGGQILQRRRWASDVERGPAAMLDDFCQQARVLLDEHPDVVELGISVGGPLDTVRGLVLAPPHLPGWEYINLAETLRQRVRLPVTVEHDAIACLLVEHLWGIARHATHAVYLTCGTGFGAGIMVDGRILRGPAGQTPELGHVRLAADGPDLYNKPGCAESFCSGRGVARLAHHLFPDHFSQETPVQELARLAEAGDDLARQVLLGAAEWTGRVCAMLGDIFSPQLIILGSLARYLPPWWLAAIRREFAAEVLEHNGGVTQITIAQTGDDLQDLSSYAACVFNRLHRRGPRHDEPLPPARVVVPPLAPLPPAASRT